MTRQKWCIVQLKTRKILLTEQFHDEKACRFATEYFMDDKKVMFEKVFKEMINAGTIKENDAEFLAVSYTAPITELIHLCDREPGRVSETIARIEHFVKQFIKIYGANS